MFHLLSKIIFTLAKFTYYKKGLESILRMLLSYIPKNEVLSLTQVDMQSNGLETEIAAFIPEFSGLTPK